LLLKNSTSFLFIPDKNIPFKYFFWLLFQKVL